MRSDWIRNAWRMEIVVPVGLLAIFALTLQAIVPRFEEVFRGLPGGELLNSYYRRVA